MKKGLIVIIDNIGGELGAYCNRREAQPFEGRFECAAIEAQKGLPRDVESWARENGVRGVVLGGAFESPLDDHDWIRREEEFVRGLLSLGIPTLAICFGHEVLGAALGCALGSFDSPRVELDTIETLENDPLFSGIDSPLRIPVSHSVFLREIPAGFKLIGKSEKCPNHAIKHGDFPIYGVQFHPEVDRDVVIHDSDWRPVPDEDFNRSDGPRVMENFRDIVLKHESGGESPT